MEPIKSDLSASPLPLLHLLELLKHLPRTGWLRTIPNPESVAAHMWRVAIMGMFAPPPLDKNRCVLLGIAHDWAEAIVGDITPHDNVSKEEKHKLEDFGFRYIESLLLSYNSTLAKDLRASFYEWEAGETPESKYMRSVDKGECMIQAFEYEQRTRGQKDLEEFQGQLSQIEDPTCQHWMDLLGHERRTYFQRRKNPVSVIFILGAPGAGKKTQVSLLCRGELRTRFRHISVSEIIQEKSNDPAYLHAAYIKDCLKENVAVATELMISLLDLEITKDFQQEEWLLISDFPDTPQQLSRFEDRVPVISYGVFLQCSADELQRRPGNSESKPPVIASAEGWQALDFQLNIVDANGSIDDVFKSVTATVKGFIDEGDAL